MRKASPETKVTKYRMWKSGKQWLFGASLVAASLLVMNTQAFADGVGGVANGTGTALTTTAPAAETSGTAAQPAAVEAVQPSQPAAMVAEVKTEEEMLEAVGEETYFHKKENAEEDKVLALKKEGDATEASKEEKKSVTIYYKPKEGDGSQYYLYVWNSGNKELDNGSSAPYKFMPMNSGMSTDGKKEWSYEVKPETSSFNYLITTQNSWPSNGDSIKVTPKDMVAVASPTTNTNIYHGWYKDKDNNNVDTEYYSPYLNVQSPEFDQKFAYKDREVDPTSETGFKVVGSQGALGATLLEDGKHAKVNLWAPTADEVAINFYESNQKDAKLIKSFKMTKGTVSNEEDHTKNTVGLWTFSITDEVLLALNKVTAEGLTYDYSLSIPNAYFIQKSAVIKDGKLEYYQYRNSATHELLNATDTDSEEVKKLSLLYQKFNNKTGKAENDVIAKFYAGVDISGNVNNLKHINRVVRTQDPYSVAVVQDGSRSVILNPSKVGTAVKPGTNKRVTSKTQMSVMEIDVRDFSIDKDSGIKEENRGNFLGVIEKGTKNSNTGTPTGLDYLKYLGVNYVQVMPIYDYQTVPELASTDKQNTEYSEAEPHGKHENQQNWGYDPKNYNVPEGSYSTDPTNPTNRIDELKQMVQGLHDAGINVVMDVVYNHLYDSQQNPFEWTVPGYVYAVQPDGAMNNDVGVGNAVRSTSEMMRQYIIHSVIYWVKEYGMDGFRFDAMSDLDTKTLTEVREALDQFDKNIVTYGEGWNSMGKYLDQSKGEFPSSIENAMFLPGYGFFDNMSRDSIAGSAYDNGPEHPGFINGRDAVRSEYNGLSRYINNTDEVSKRLLGGFERNYLDASQQLNYVEVHDGMTLHDLMKSFNPNEDDEMIENRVELATAMSALAQGIHFSQHGQEFLRTKGLDTHDGKQMYRHNTYNSGDIWNKIDWSLVTKNADTVNFNKSLLSLRQAESLWHLSDYQNEILKKMTITNAQPQSGIITYELQEDNGDKFLVVFNNNMSDNHSLTLGGDEYYYGRGPRDGEYRDAISGHRGKINDTNDFTNAYIVLTNSQNLYEKIGQMNGKQTITFDPVSASVLYIPVSAKTTLEHKVLKDNNQEVTYLTVTSRDMESKFTYDYSGIDLTKNDVADETELGHLKNVLTKVDDGIKDKTLVYYATDKLGKSIKIQVTPQLVNGIPQDTEDIIWKEVTEAAPAELNVSQDSGEATEESPKESERPSEGSTVGNNFEQGESVTQKKTVTVTSQVDFPKSQSTKPEEKLKLTAKSHQKAVKREVKHQEKQLKLERKTAKKMAKKGHAYAWGNKHYFAFDGAVLHLGKNKHWFR